jgi:glycosyltransferase involved in cell wall biosynthesis
MKFSIITPCKDSAATINRAIESVRNQENCLFDYEIILIPANPNSDNTYQAISDKENVVVIKSEVPIPLSSSRNFGIEAAKGDVVCFLDSDDFFAPNAFSKVFQVLNEHLDVSLVVGEVRSNSLDGPLFSPNYRDDHFLQSNRERDCFISRRDGLIVQLSGYFFRSNVLKQSTIRFKRDLANGEDTLFLVEALCFAPLIYVCNTTFAVYTENPDGDHHKYTLERNLSYPKSCLMLELELFKQLKMVNSARACKDVLIEFLSYGALYSKEDRKALAKWYRANHTLTITRGTRHWFRRLLFLLFGYRFVWFLLHRYRELRKR